MKGYGRAVNQQLSGDVTSAEISTDVVSNLQLQRVQVCTEEIWIASHTLHEAGVRRLGDFSFVFPEERCKVGCADDAGTGSFDGHERRGGTSS